MRWILPFALAGLAAFGTAKPEVFDFGELDQYNSKEQNPPSLSGSTLWLSGTEEDGGFDVGLSPDIKAKIQGVLEGCGQLDDKCYQETRKVLRSAHLEVDRKLERRHFGHMLSKTIKGGWAIFADFAANLYMSLFQKSKDLEGAESFMFIPVSKASEAAKLETATDVVISAGGTAVATITPKPDPTSLKGSHAPSVTAVTSAHDGLSQGDLVVSLDQNLASRMQEIMMRTTECEDGTRFDREHASKRRANSGLGRAICAYQGVILNMGAALSDLTQTDFGVLDFAIPATPPDRAAAAELTQQLMEEYAPLMNLPMDRARALAAYLFALTIGVVIDENPLGTNNKIPASLVQTGAPTSRPTQTTASATSSSSSGCPDPTKTPLMCGWDSEKDNNCEVVMPKATEDEPKCTEKGKYPNCPCNTPTDNIIQMTSNEEQKAIKMFDELFKNNKVPEAEKPQCTQVNFDASNAYVFRDTLADLIDNQYCPKLEGMSSGIGLGRYLPNTPEAVEIGAISDIDVRDKPPSVDDCKKHLHEVLDGCDIPHDDYNPMNWKAGGEIKVDGWTYSLRPLQDRPPALNKPKAWCQIDSCNQDGCTLRVWGAGWESSNFGKALREKLDDFTRVAKESGKIGNNKGYDTGSWEDNFIYELMNGHEWTVTLPVNLGIFVEYGPTTANVMRLAAKDLEVEDCKEV